MTPSFSTLWLLKPEPPSGLRSPFRYGPSCRTMSQRPFVTGSSMRITWAPNAASTRVDPAPASWPDRSQMRMPLSAPECRDAFPMDGAGAVVSTSLPSFRPHRHTGRRTLATPDPWLERGRRPC